MRYKTKTFQLIENYLKTCCDKCFRAHDVYDYIVANEMKVNISTVYRNLEQFVDAGQLIKYKPGNNDVWMYRLNQQFSQCHEHLHLQCKECGKIIHIKNMPQYHWYMIWKKESKTKIQEKFIDYLKQYYE